MPLAGRVIACAALLLADCPGGGAFLLLDQQRSRSKQREDAEDVGDLEPAFTDEDIDVLATAEDQAGIAQDGGTGHFCGFHWHHGPAPEIPTSTLLRTNSGDLLGSTQICFDDMCVDRSWASRAAKQVDLSAALQIHSKVSITPACPADMPADERLLIVPQVPAYHASTALEQILMSSLHVSTLCAAGTWQCEGRWIIKKYGVDGLLDTYGKYWNLTKKIFMDKRPTNGSNLQREFIKPFEKSPLPKNMADAGIRKLSTVYLLMWRPICLASLSSHANKSRDYAEREMGLMEQTLQSYHYLVDSGHQVLVINIADLLWKRDFAKQRLQAFLPCVGDISFDFAPKLGQQVVSCNKWKAHGSVAEFGDAIEPRSLGYSREEAQCSDDANNLFNTFLEDTDRERASSIQKELADLSRL